MASSDPQPEPLIVVVLLCLAVVFTIGGMVGALLADQSTDVKVYLFFSSLLTGAFFWWMSAVVSKLHQIAAILEERRDAGIAHS